MRDPAVVPHDLVVQEGVFLCAGTAAVVDDIGDAEPVALIGDDADVPGVDYDVPGLPLDDSRGVTGEERACASKNTRRFRTRRKSMFGSGAVMAV